MGDPSKVIPIHGAPVLDAVPRPGLEVRDLAHVIRGRPVLALRAWQVAQGGHSLVIGPSGCGKSTLLHAIAGLIRPSRGHVVIDGQDLSALGPAALDRFRGHHIGIVPQSMHLIAALSVRDNLRLARSVARRPPAPGRIQSLLNQLGLGTLSRARPHELSQGERQRVAIARAVVNEPTLILADEPTSALDDANCGAVLDLLHHQAQESGAMLVVATHDRRLEPHFGQRLMLTAPA